MSILRAAPSYEELVRVVSAARLRPYLQVAHQDQATAAALYVWNVDISGALWQLIAHFEIALRNALARELETLVASSRPRARWFNERSWFTPWERARISEAKAAVRKHSKVPSSDLVIPEMTFAFWASLLDGVHHAALWIPALRLAFPHSTGDRGAVRGAVGSIGSLRNLIAHHDPIINKNFLQQEEQILRACHWIDPSFADWVAVQSDVRRVLARQPVVVPSLRFSPATAVGTR